MKVLLFVVVFTVFTLAFPKVDAVCYCPIVCENCHRGGGIKHVHGRAPCNDIESRDECQQANWELLNKRDTTITLVETIMSNALEKGNFTGLHVGFLRSILALAVEDERPEGDCSNGLSTTTGMEGTLTHCFSPELLEQCAKVASATDEYLDGIAPRFEKYVRSTTLAYNVGVSYLDASRNLGLVFGPGDQNHEIVEEIIEVIRVYSGAKTARVRCASYRATTNEIISAASPTVISIASILVTALVFAFYL